MALSLHLQINSLPETLLHRPSLRIYMKSKHCHFTGKKFQLVAQSNTTLNGKDVVVDTSEMFSDWE